VFQKAEIIKEIIPEGRESQEGLGLPKIKSKTSVQIRSYAWLVTTRILTADKKFQKLASFVDWIIFCYFLLVQSAKESTKEHAQFTGTLLVLCRPLNCFVVPSSFNGKPLQGIMGPRVFNGRHLGHALMNVVTKLPGKRVSYNAHGSGH